MQQERHSPRSENCFRGKPVIPDRSMCLTVLTSKQNELSWMERQATGTFSPKWQRPPALGLAPRGSQGSECPTSSFWRDGQVERQGGHQGRTWLSPRSVTPEHPLVFNAEDTTWNQNVPETFCSLVGSGFLSTTHSEGTTK